MCVCLTVRDASPLKLLNDITEIVHTDGGLSPDTASHILVATAPEELQGGGQKCTMGEILQKVCYINTLTFLPFYIVSVFN